MKPEQLEQMKSRQTFQNVWHVPLMNSIGTDPGFCCLTIWCPNCVSYQLRRRALYGDMTRYLCCGGYMPCSGKIKEEQCPEVCLATETCCCFVQSVMSTRWMLQDEFRIQTTPCDNCLISFMFILQQISCICSLLACLTGSDELEDIAECLRCLSDTVTCSVTSCMQTQHKLEMDKRDGLIEIDPAAAMGVPPLQQMSRNDDVVPPPANGIPGQQYAYGYPAPAPGLPPPIFTPGPPSVYTPGPYPPPQVLPPPVYPPQAYPPPNAGVFAPNPSQLPPPLFEPGPHPPPNLANPSPVSAPSPPPPPQKM